MDWQKIEGAICYEKALAMMEEKLARVINGQSDETVYLLEHEPIYTAGTNARDEEFLGGVDVPVVRVGRGGKYTYHGPGQRVIYPIINLSKAGRSKDIKLYVKMLEEWVINSLSRFDILCYVIPDKVGIWTDVPVELKLGTLKSGAVGPGALESGTVELGTLESGTVEPGALELPEQVTVPAKIGAIGIRVRKWVTYHGIAVNIANDLDMYRGIIPCGISEFPVTSMYELGHRVSYSDFDRVLEQEFNKIF